MRTKLQESWNQYEEEAMANGELFIGRRQGGLTEIEPSISSTISVDNEGELIAAEPLVFATRSLQVAIFAGSVWSRDGWSGWHTYEDEEGIYHKFFAIPAVLREALDEGGYVYRVSEEYFTPGHILGEYVSHEVVPVTGPSRPATILDMQRAVFATTYETEQVLRAATLSPLPTEDYIRATGSGDPRPMGNGYEIFSEIPLPVRPSWSQVVEL